MLLKILKNNIFLHFFTNSVLLLNFTFKGGGNKVTGRLRGFLLKSRIYISGRGNRIEFGKGFSIQFCKIYIKGNNNKITIADNCYMRKATIWIIGDNNNFRMSEDCWAVNTEFGLENNSNAIIMRPRALAGGFVWLGWAPNLTMPIRIYACEGKKILIGSGSVISEGVSMRTGDSHSIFNKDRQRINYGADIEIGDGVWICSGAALLKGAKLAKGCILGMNSVLTKDFSHEENTVIAGAPALVIRENVSWEL